MNKNYYNQQPQKPLFKWSEEPLIEELCKKTILASHFVSKSIRDDYERISEGWLMVIENLIEKDPKHLVFRSTTSVLPSTENDALWQMRNKVIQTIFMKFGVDIEKEKRKKKISI